MFGSTKKMTLAQLLRETKCDRVMFVYQMHTFHLICFIKKSTIPWCEVAIGRENIKVLWLDLPSVILNSTSKVVTLIQINYCYFQTMFFF